MNPRRFCSSGLNESGWSRQRALRRVGLLLAFLLGLCWLGHRARGAETVIVSEFMAGNISGITDEDGETSDWIELFNASAGTVNLAGWRLTDDAANPAKWIFPAVSLAPNGTLIVFASGKNRTNPLAPLHTSFSLTSGGEYLGLIEPDGVTVASEFAPAYPSQYDDVSYGRLQTVATTRFVASNAPVRIFVPAGGALGTTWTGVGFDDAGWLAGTNGVGYEVSVPGFAVRTVRAASGVSIGGLAAAETLLATPAQQQSTFLTNAAPLNYFNSGSEAHYSPSPNFPGLPAGLDVEQFVVEATGFVTIPTSGAWSFGVNSDDGFKVTIGTNSFQWNDPRGPSDTLATFTLAAGEYPVRLLFYEATGGSGLEFFAAPGALAAWTTAFKLVGDTANGGLSVRSLPSSGSGSIRSLIATDIQLNLLNKGSSAYVRIPFTVADAAAVSTLTLRMRYDDGVVAYLNGTEVARRNVPAVVLWNSVASASRPTAAATAAETVDLTAFRALLQSGNNVLALHGLNSATNDTDLLLHAELVESVVTGATNDYLAASTPGAFNVAAAYSRVADTKFSHDRGFYSTNFNLVITCATPGATIYFTTNGTVPKPGNGTVYTTAIPVNRTVNIRAAAYKTGLTPSDVDTHTYLFLRDVVNQSPTGLPPAGWPSSWGANVVDYGMDPEVVTNAVYGPQLEGALRSLPTYSLVMDLNDLFGAQGIYANPSGDTIVWERPGSMELINPGGEPGFHANCGVRIRGGFSRSTDNPKHAFRFFFRREYGLSKLEYPVFGPPPAAQEFDKFDLRCAQNYSWAFQGDARGNFMRDQFSRDTQLALGQAGEHGNYVHLYINGQYWGLYNTDERPEAAFGESYFGGAAESYDTIKVAPDDGYIIVPTDGNLSAWRRLWDLSVAGYAGDTNYFRAQGLNADGTRNPAYENLIDVGNLIDYMLVIIYGGNLDAPISNFLGNNSPNNNYSLRSTNGFAGFRFIAHDSEHTLLNVNEDRTGPFVAGDPTQGSTFDKSSPQYVWSRMSANPEFRMRVADRIQQTFFNGGPMSVEANIARFMARSNEIYAAVVAESARWGDAKRAAPLTRSDWLNAVRDVVDNFFPGRAAVVLSQLQADNLWPALRAPVLRQFGGFVAPGYSLTMTNPNTTGLIYYTTDGSDPRLRGGAINPAAAGYSALNPPVLGGSVLVRSRVKDGATWSPMTEALFYLSQDFSRLQLTELNYNPPGEGAVSGDEFEFVELKNTGANALDLGGLAFSGITFSFTNGSFLAPGAFAVLVRNPAQFAARYPGVAIRGVYTGRLDNGGETVRLIHPLGGAVLSVTYGDSAPWPLAPDSHGFTLVPRDGVQNPDPEDGRNWRGSAAVVGSPGADDPDPGIPGLLITEVLSHSDPAGSDSVEIHNPTAVDADLRGWFLTDDRNQPRRFRFEASLVVPAGGYVVVPETAFDSPLLGTNAFGLGANGDSVYLLSGSTGTNLTGYSHGLAFGAAVPGVSFGRYLTSIGAEHFPPQSARTPGASNAGPLVGPVVINEIQYHPLDGFEEYIELVNISASPVPLYDPAFPTNRWRVNGAGFELPADVILPPGGYAVIAGSDPVAFRSKYGVPAAVPVFGPYNGALQNDGERVELQRPGAPDTNGSVPYIVVDGVRYNDRLPWPVAADGSGPALQRWNSAAYADDPINWVATGATPGRANAANQLPTVALTSPSPGTVVNIPATVTLTAAASDADGFVRRVEFFDGAGKIGEVTNAPYTMVWTQPAPGTRVLTARVLDDALGSATSAEVTITVVPPPFGNGVGLRAEYFPTMTLSGTPVRRVDSTVNFDWGSGSPVAGIPVDQFSARWTGRVLPRFSENHTFATISDDGVRLWVNNQLIIDNWTDHGPTENSGTIALVAGQYYDIRMEFYENGGGATAKLSWSSDNTPKQIIPTSQLFPPVSLPPSVTLLTPGPNQVYVTGQPVRFTSTAADSDGSVVRVEYYADGTRVADGTNGPSWSAAWSTPVVGTHTVFGVAVDDTAGRATSAVVSVTIVPGFQRDFSVISSNSLWRYLDDGSNQGTAWRGLDFNDSGWSNGLAQLGAGDNDEATRVRLTNAQPGRIVTHYFRQRFTLATLDGITNALLRVLRDDGAVAYINGIEVFRSNMPTGAVNFRTLAVASVTGVDENTMFPTNVSGSVFRVGTNVLAVEVHQQSTNNTDLSFAADLTVNQLVIAPSIVSQPQSRTNTPGSTATFSVVASGFPLAYQWLRDGVMLPGATNATLTLPSVAAADAGAYRVAVTNLASLAYSEPAILTVTSLDTDGDGMPDDWELAHGLNPFVNDALADADLDGAGNLAEFLAGTDPRNANSALRLQVDHPNDNGVLLLQFVAEAGLSYSVLHRPDATSGTWQKLQDIPAGAQQRTMSILDVVGANTQRFYRLVTPAQP